MLNPLWLKTFITLIETGHFTRTAERLFMTQPGVSQHIKKLEQACGHPLIERNNKSFEITQQGKMLFDYAKESQNRETQLLASLEPDSAYHGNTKLACSGSLALLLYPRLLDLQCKCPKLITHVEAAPNRKIKADILSGMADLGIVTSQTNDKRIFSQTLSEEPLCLMYPAQHSYQGDLTKSDLQQLGLINHPDAEHYLARFFAHSDDPDFVDLRFDQIPITGYVNQLSQILLPVAKGLGFTILPLSALDNFALKEQIAIYQPKQPITETLYLIAKQRPHMPKRFVTVIDEIEQALKRS
ncbi:LysR family transcriptional regulator [Vibrio scophthalmi]|uniref:LysR family transcriptional regulator n=1 Tax=Vibrio scophthalmi TaxID=45658 RepID=UPI003AAC38B7